MATVGPSFPTSTASVAVGGRDALSWSNPNNAQSNDGSYTACTGTGAGPGYRLECKGFNFNIPSGSVTINGITVSIERKASTNTATDYIQDYEVQLIKADGTYNTQNKADLTTKWLTTDVVVNYGSSSDVWGGTWSYTDINDPDFGVVISVNEGADFSGSTGSIDYVTITVDYTVTAYSFPAAVGTFTLTGQDSNFFKTISYILTAAGTAFTLIPQAIRLLLNGSTMVWSYTDKAGLTITPTSKTNLTTSSSNKTSVTITAMDKASLTTTSGDKNTLNITNEPRL